MTGDPSSLQSKALAYYDLGLAVLPLHTVEAGSCSCKEHSACNRPGKHPRISWKSLRNERLSREAVRKCWQRWPSANIGVITGRISGLTVLDIDGEEGLESLETIGLTFDTLPMTPTVRTGGGGLHLYFQHTDDAPSTAVGVLPSIDIRAEGGLVVLPPSSHISGINYTWLEDRGIDLPFANFDWSRLHLSEPITSVPKETKTWYLDLLRGISEPGRNEATARLAGRYCTLGLSEEEVYLLLRGWNRGNDPPLTDEELRKTTRSIWAAEHKEDLEKQDQILEQISSILKVTLLSAKRISGDEPKIVLQFDCGTATLTTARLLNPALFQQTVAEATKVVPRRFSSKTVPTHDRLAQMVLSACEEIDAGEEATSAGELMLLIGDYLGSNNLLPHIRKEEEAPLRGPFISGNRVWISAVDLLQRASMRWSKRPTLSDLAQRMKSIEMVRQTFPLPGGGDRSMWGIAISRVPFVQIDDDIDATQPVEETTT